MSTQRREIRFIPETKVCRREHRNRSQRKSCTGRARVLGMAFAVPFARHDRANANGGTAPPGILERVATISVYLGCRIVQLVLHYLRQGTPPPKACRGAETGTPAKDGSSLRHTPCPSGVASFHPISPQVPAGSSRWAERYDGKGNLYLQHAP